MIAPTNKPNRLPIRICIPHDGLALKDVLGSLISGPFSSLASSRQGCFRSLTSSQTSSGQFIKGRGSGLKGRRSLGLFPSSVYTCYEAVSTSGVLAIFVRDSRSCKTHVVLLGLVCGTVTHERGP